jgi:hypothetical protein
VEVAVSTPLAGVGDVLPAVCPYVAELLAVVALYEIAGCSVRFNFDGNVTGLSV